ncbi:MAG: molybdopterin-binding protein [Clostridiales bacterium]|nr:molybdopterin-binding protein [Clostridiales bacterium]
MKLINTRDAVGHVLCHDLTKIVPGQCKGAAFRKGHVVREEDVETLLSMGKEHLYVWEAGPHMLHEDEAAQVLRSLCQNEHMAASDPVEGKIDLTAQVDGLFTVDVEGLRRVNSLGEMMIATRLSHTPVKKGDKLAGMRVIPLVIEKEKMERAKAAAGERFLMALHPYQKLQVGVVTTGNEVATGRIQDGFTPVLLDKLKGYGSEVCWHELPGDDSQRITEAIRNMIRQGAQMVLCTGGMSVDPDDRTPLAIKNATDTVISYGAPVLPGAMFMLAYAGSVPVVGLPGCVMYARRTIFDLVLPRILAGLAVTREELAALGHGGLCLHCDPCIFPNCGFGRGV